MLIIIANISIQVQKKTDLKRAEKVVVNPIDNNYHFLSMMMNYQVRVFV